MARLVTKAGYRALAVPSGQQALELLRKGPVDVLITDVVLGDVNGLDLLSEAKKEDPDIEVILITGYGSIDGAVEATKAIPVDLRFISATNKDLKRLGADGLFHQDLYYRLNVIAIPLPTLAERQKGIPLLAAFFLRRFARLQGKGLRGFSEEALGVRELENIVERAVSLTLGEIEREYSHWMLRRTKQNKSEAARLLEIDRVSLYRKLKRFAFDE